MAQVISLEKAVVSKLEQATCLVNIYCAFKDIKLSKSEREVMAFFIVYGINKKTKEMIVESAILKNQNSVGNLITELHKKKLLVKGIEKDEQRNSFSIIPTLNIKFDSKLGIFIKIERS